MNLRLSFLALVLAALSPAATIQSSFGTDHEGWTVTNDGGDTSVVYQGGSIARTDQTAAYMHFAAPVAFRGDLTGFASGVLAYDMRQTTASADPSWFYRTVLEGNGLLLLYTQELAPDTANFRTLLTPLSADGWIVIATLEDYLGSAVTPLQFSGVLANVTGLYITGDLISGQGDFAELDNVILTTTPEPGTFAALAVGLAGLAMARRRARHV